MLRTQPKPKPNDVTPDETAKNNVNNDRLGKVELSYKVYINCRSYGVDGRPSATTQEGNLDKELDKRSTWKWAVANYPTSKVKDRESLSIDWAPSTSTGEGNLSGRKVIQCQLPALSMDPRGVDQGL